MSDKKKNIIIPWSKGNEEAHKPIPQNIALTVGPLPIGAIASARLQIEEQKWTVTDILFAGHTSESRLSLSQPQAVPVYFMIVTKMHFEGEEIVEPTLMIGSQPANNVRDGSKPSQG
jgi:hypothetical protein